MALVKGEAAQDEQSLIPTTDTFTRTTASLSIRVVTIAPKPKTPTCIWTGMTCCKSSHLQLRRAPPAPSVSASQPLHEWLNAGTSFACRV